MEHIWKPHATVAAVIEREGRFLLVEEVIEGEIRYNQPAGHLDEDESLVAACIRETLEETAWHFTPTALIGVYQWKRPENGASFLRFCFTGTADAHEAGRALDDGILRAVWLTPEEIRASRAKHRSPLLLQCVEDYLAGRRYPLEILRYHAPQENPHG